MITIQIIKQFVKKLLPKFKNSKFKTKVKRNLIPILNDSPMNKIKQIHRNNKTVF